jgi:malate dehydrogenase (oxaloacetate-decarboxylating)(NADP+)
MKLAAVYAIAALAKEPVPEEVNEAYSEKNIVFGKDFIIPKPMDPRLISTIAPAVAKAAIDSGVAQHVIKDWEEYRRQLAGRLGLDNKLLKNITQRTKRNPKRVVFAEADNYKTLKAATIVKDEGIAIPILLGKVKVIEEIAKEFSLDITDLTIIDPRSSKETARKNKYAQLLFEKRKRRGVTMLEARDMVRSRNYFGSAMVEVGDADALISGLTRNYRNTIRPALQVIGTDDDVSKIAGMYILMTKQGPFFLADTTVNVNPSVQDIVDITVLSAKIIQRFKVNPRIALLSFSNFGSSDEEDAVKMREAAKILHEQHPEIVVDGEIQGNFALNKELRDEIFPFSDLARKNTNTLIFPNLSSGNIAYKLLQEMAGFETIGPILMGMKKPVHILQLGSSVREIVNMVTIAVADAQTRK